jgi:hypothetical protein
MRVPAPKVFAPVDSLSWDSLSWVKIQNFANVGRRSPNVDAAGRARAPLVARGCRPGVAGVSGVSSVFRPELPPSGR